MSNNYPVAIAERMLGLGRDLDIPVFTRDAEAKLQAYLDALELYTDVHQESDMRMVRRFILHHRWNTDRHEAAIRLLNYVHIPFEDSDGN